MSALVRTGYSPAQIALHWLVAALVIFQLVFGESMAEMVEAAEEGKVLSGTETALGNAHYWVGIAVLALAALRLLLRIVQGAPAPIGGGALGLAATGAHHLFYLLLFAAPVTGLLGFYLGEPWNEVHEISKPAFVILIFVHAAGALFHAFWLHDGTLRRMVVPQRS